MVRIKWSLFPYKSLVVFTSDMPILSTMATMANMTALIVILGQTYIGKTSWIPWTVMMLLWWTVLQRIFIFTIILITIMVSVMFLIGYWYGTHTF